MHDRIIVGPWSWLCGIWSVHRIFYETCEERRLVEIRLRMWTWLTLRSHASRRRRRRRRRRHNNNNAWIGPEVLKNYQSHTLLLCYPDDFQTSDQSLAMRCFNKFQGDTIIHVGESFGLTYQENPWYFMRMHFTFSHFTFSHFTFSHFTFSHFTFH